MTAVDRTTVLALVDGFLARHAPATCDPREFLRARFDAGLATVANPVGMGGLGAPATVQPEVDAAFAAAGAPDNRPLYNVIGLGMAAPTILRFGSPAQCDRWLRPLWTGEEIWCQLFSEPGAGSDLASLATSAVRDGDDWVVDGEKVWTSLAHEARWALLIARTDRDVPKHQGLTYFVCDMRAPGLTVRPLRQITGETEFNHVFLDGVRIPDAYRLGDVGQGWRVAQATLMNERVAIGGAVPPREGGPVGPLCDLWRDRDDLRRPALHDRLMELWVEAEALRLTSIRVAQRARSGQPGPEGSGAKLSYAALAQAASSLELDLLGAEGLRYADWTARRPELVDLTRRPANFRYLRSRAISIEGGTSEIMRNIIAERILGLPAQERVDRDVPWRDLPR